MLDRSPLQSEVLRMWDVRFCGEVMQRAVFEKFDCSIWASILLYMRWPLVPWLMGQYMIKVSLLLELANLH